MADDPQRTHARLLITSSAFLAAAAAFGVAGIGVATVALGIMTRRRINRMEVPPSEHARRQLRQARAAFRAGAGAWRGNGSQLHVDNGTPAVRESVSSS
jgi:hypothetical protein